MRIEIWSDVVCPWCYIGKRRLESALADFPHEVEVVWRSFQLDPAAPHEDTTNMAEHLGHKYGGGPAAGQQMIDRIEAVAAEEGLLFRLGEARRGNTVDAHRLLHHALERHGPALQDRLKEQLLAAYFLHARNPADHDVLVAAAGEAGLEEAQVREVLDSDTYAAEVEADIRRAASLGATGVPFFVIDERYGVSGAQPAESLRQVLDRAWADGHPALAMVGGGEQNCGPEGCCDV